MINTVYIATSLDGYIADKNGGLDWLTETPNPEELDFGSSDFMNNIDAVVMGRNTFDVVCRFGAWPYNKPVFILSRVLKKLSTRYEGKAELISGSPTEVTRKLNQKGFKRLYIDGGNVIQNFLKEDLIDEMIITQIPILLGGGIFLFDKLKSPVRFEHIKTEILLGAMVKTHYRKK